MAAKRGKNQARRNGNGGRPAWVWAVAGLAIGALLFLAVPSLLKKDGDRFVRFGPARRPGRATGTHRRHRGHRRHPGPAAGRPGAAVRFLHRVAGQ